MELDASAPIDEFALHPGAARTVLIGDGIGITPMSAMACALHAAGHGFELHYLVRDAGRLVLMEDLAGLSRGAIRTYVTDQGRRPDLAAVIGHVESFGARSASGDKPVRVYLRQSDIALDVAPGTSILDATIAADAFVSYGCQRGECGKWHHRHEAWQRFNPGEPTPGSRWSRTRPGRCHR